jgi:hypothetical protein
LTENFVGFKKESFYPCSIFTDDFYGVMLATFFDLLPEAAEMGGNQVWLVLAGIVFLFLTEKSLLWYHHHGTSAATMRRGSTVVNKRRRHGSQFIDGLQAVVANPALGMVRWRRRTRFRTMATWSNVGAG